MKKTAVYLLILACVMMAGCASAPKDVPKPAADTAGLNGTAPSGGAADTAPAEGEARESTPAPAAADGDSARGGKAERDDRMAASTEERSSVPMGAMKARKKDGGSRTYAEGASGAPAPSPRPATPETSGLKAGYADDNKQYNYFIGFLEKYKNDAAHFPIPVEERIIIRVKDKNGKSIPNARVSIRDSRKKILAEGRTYADGTYLFFPSEHDKAIREYHAIVTANQASMDLVIDRAGKREIDVVFNTERAATRRIPMDLLFVMDTTGSMGEEIARLKSTIDIINMNLASMPAKPSLRFGMVLYRDRGDAYVTRVIPFTGDLKKFQSELDRVEADGGGDGPEDLQSALKDTISGVKWNTDGIRLAFVITDAQPHLDYGQEYTYVNAARDARKQGIKIFTVGTGGLDINGEYVLRQVSQYTYARYIFLTYGEKTESEGGREGSVSHHTGTNFQTDKLESIIIRFAREELAFLSDTPLESGEEYFQARRISDEKREETLSKLFDMAIPQLIDYSSIGLAPGTAASVVPLSFTQDSHRVNAEYFTEQLSFALSRSRVLKIVERKDMQKILSELSLQNTGMMDEDTAARFGKLIGAEVLITGTVYARDGSWEIFLKMYRVETGEVLAVTKVRLDRELGLN